MITYCRLGYLDRYPHERMLSLLYVQKLCLFLYEDKITPFQGQLKQLKNAFLYYRFGNGSFAFLLNIEYA